jgi:hypothetical protein
MQWKRTISILCAGAIAFLGAQPMIAGAFAQTDEEEKSASYITIRYGDASRRFKGTVGAARGCQRFRRVYLKKHRPGRNSIVGRDTTSRHGNWKIHRRHHRGRYYAVAVRKAVTDQNGNTLVCQWDRSPTIKI